MLDSYVIGFFLGLKICNCIVILYFFLCFFFLHDKSNWILFWVWIIFLEKNFNNIFFLYLDKKFFSCLFFLRYTQTRKKPGSHNVVFFLNRSENNIKRSTLFCFQKIFNTREQLLMRVLGFFFLVKCKDFHNNIEGWNILKMFFFRRVTFQNNKVFLVVYIFVVWV